MDTYKPDVARGLDRGVEPTQAANMLRGPEAHAPLDRQPLILIADDDPDILGLVGLRLENAGYRTLRASDGSQALALTRQHQPDLVVLDVDMPYLSGYEVTEQLQELAETRDIPVLLLTSRRTEADVLAGLTAGAHDYLMKPFSPQELEVRIASLIARG